MRTLWVEGSPKGNDAPTTRWTPDEREQLRVEAIDLAAAAGRGVK